jgi:heat shock protein HspQ
MGRPLTTEALAELKPLNPRRERDEPFRWIAAEDEEEPVRASDPLRDG